MKKAFLVLTCIGILISTSSTAQKIYGGQFDRRAATGSFVNTPYAYRFACAFFADAAGSAALPASLRFRIIRKRDNAIVREYTATKAQDASTSVLNNCPVAGATTRTDYLMVRYNYDMVITPTEFNDTEGYYVVNDPVGPRNPAVNTSSSNVVLYHWFSPQYLFEQLDSGSEGRTASFWGTGTLGYVEGYDYLCKDFRAYPNFQVGVTPGVTVFNSQNLNLVLKTAPPLTDGALPFSTVAWRAGYGNSSVLPTEWRISGQNAVFQNSANTTAPPIVSFASVSATIIASQNGVHSIGYILEHYKNGVKIAENYREMQVEVSDCIKTTYISHYVTEVNSEQQASASLCTGQQVRIRTRMAQNQTDLSYVWYRNKQLIAGETGSSLVVSQAGRYYAIATKLGSCTPSTQPDTIEVVTTTCNTSGNARILGGNMLEYVSTGLVSAGPVPAYWNDHNLQANYYTYFADFPLMPPTVRGRIYRKRDNAFVEEFTMTRGGSSETTQLLPRFCGTGSDTVQVVGYRGRVVFDATRHNDPQGYYIVSGAICCRAATDNLTPNTPYVNYAEVGPANSVTHNNVSNRAHTVFAGLPSRMQACAGQAISVEIPFYNAQNVTARITGFTETITSSTGTVSFANVDWRAGYTTDNFNGNTTRLQLNPATGRLTGTPERPGVYVYRVRVEGIQDGVVLSTIFTEFRLDVRDCRSPLQPTIFVSKVGQPNVAASTTVCQDSSVQLNLRNFTKGSSFQWRLSGGNLAQATDSIYVVRNSQTGAYSATTRTPNLCPEIMTAAAINIVFTPLPTATFTVAEPSGINCSNTPTNLTATATGNMPFSYQWFRDNQIISGATMPVYAATNAGTYLVRVRDINGCVNASATQNVVPKTPPTAEITAPKRAVCQGQSLTLSATTGTGYSYAWTRDEQAQTGTSNTLTISQAGSYVVRVTAPNMCSTSSMAFVVLQATNPTITISGGTQLCQGTSLTLVANGPNIKNYQWTRNGQNINNETKASLNLNQAGNYSVAVSDTNGCTATATSVVELVAKINVALDSIGNFCGTAFTPVMLRGTPTGGIFSGNGVSGNSFDPKAAGIGQHTISYNVMGNLACLTGQAQRIVTITPPPSLHLGADREIFRGGQVQLSGDLGAGYVYTWTPPTGLSNANISQPFASPERTTNYVLRAVGPNNCIAIDTITISVVQGIYIPDTFTPNNDAINDVWELKGIEEYPEAEVSIFDRWGNLIFYEKGMNQHFFDGMSNGKMVSVGIYAYHIKTSPTGRSIRGSLLLVR